MGERLGDELVVRAPLARVWSIITDVATYPEWIEGVVETEVLSVEDGRPSSARFRVDARVAEVSYRLAYRYEGDDVHWTLIEGDPLSQLDGSYLLEEVGEAATRVRYRVEVDLDVPVPGFLKKRVARGVLDRGLVGLRDRAEREDADRGP